MVAVDFLRSIMRQHKVQPSPYVSSRVSTRREGFRTRDLQFDQLQKNDELVVFETCL